MLKQAGDLSGKVIISCSLPMNKDDTELVAERVIRDVGFHPIDAGPLRIARFMEPFGLLAAQLAYEQELGPALAYRFESRDEMPS